jgi:hypothetical protein
MKYKFMFTTALLATFMAMNVFAYDATGMWNYSEHSAYNYCGITYTTESGEVGILQDGTSFLIVGGDFSTYGTVSGNSYTYTDAFCAYEGVVYLTGTITLTSATGGNAVFTWDYYEGGVYYCYGGHQSTVTKQSQAAPDYDATGKWNFTQTGGKRSGYFTVTQTGNKITAVDDLGYQYSGYVNGSEYAVVRSYLESGGRTTDWYTITLSSETEGGGQGHYVWDNDCTDSSGSWSITVSKEVYTITATATEGGTISPTGAVIVNSGASQEFQITADSGYVISDVLVDDVSVGAVPSHTFSDVSEDHTIHAVFQLEKAAGTLPSLLLLLE